jgi:hypothetical protein
MSPESLDSPPASPPPSASDRIKLHNWDREEPICEDPINDNTRLVRYIKLETFLLMLNSRVFIPALECLRALDPLESRLPHAFHRDRYFEAMKPITSPHQEWLDRGPDQDRAKPAKRRDVANPGLAAATRPTAFRAGETSTGKSLELS